MKKSNIEQDREILTSFFLRTGLAVVFFYAAISSLMQPSSWVGFIPAWIREIFSGDILLKLFSTYELILGLWLISNKKTFYAAAFTSLTMLAILIANITQLDIIFRDACIFLSAIALMFLSYRKGRN